MDESRQRIDEVDREIVRLLAERMEAVRKIGGFKNSNAEAPFRDLERERQIFERWSKEAESLGLSSYFAGRVLREVLNYSRRYQEGLIDSPAPGAVGQVIKVGYQGVPSSYSDLTISKVFAHRGDPSIDRVGFHTFTAAVEALEAREVDYALLPVENTIAGSLNEVYQLLLERPITVVGEEVWPVEHRLAGLPGARLDGVRKIRSHPVALQQCEKFIESVGGAVTESFFDTAAAAESVSIDADPKIAAICSEESVLRNGLEILHRDVADHEANFTRFLLLSMKPEPVDLRKPAKTSLTLTVNHRRGALAACLQHFARQDINLTKLESRPRPEAPWEYLFYLDIEGNIDDPKVKATLDEVRGFTNHFKVIGCYLRCTEESEPVPSVVVEQPPESLMEDEEPVVFAPPDQPEHAEVSLGKATFGGNRFTVIAGPCAVENRQQIFAAAELVKQRGASVLRGGAFKPRSSPHSFQGLGFPGLDLLAEASRTFEIPFVTEVLRLEDVDRIADKADALQVGARNMQNFELLKKLGRTNRTVILKRGMSATISEVLSAAEYILDGGNQRIILCERGIRTFETSTRATLDVSAVPVLKSRTHLPVIVDPSHAAGQRYLVIPLALAAAAVGADGIIVEVHPDPDAALCDKEQALTAKDFEDLMRQLGPIVLGQGRALE